MMPAKPMRMPASSAKAPFNPLKLLLTYVSTLLVKVRSMRYQARACTHARLSSHQLFQPEPSATGKQAPAMPHSRGAANSSWAVSLDRRSPSAPLAPACLT